MIECEAKDLENALRLVKPLAHKATSMLPTYRDKVLPEAEKTKADEKVLVSKSELDKLDQGVRDNHGDSQDEN